MLDLENVKGKCEIETREARSWLDGPGLLRRLSKKGV